MHPEKHAVRKTGEHYVLYCAFGDRTWPYDPPVKRAILVCPVCKISRLDIEHRPPDSWIIHEDYT